MRINNSNINGHHTPQERLRTALAVNKVSDLIKEYLKEADAIPKHDQSLRGNYFRTIYEALNRRMFEDTHSHSQDSTQVGKIDNPETRETVLSLITQLSNQLFDENGAGRTHDALNTKAQLKKSAEYMAEFYIAMRKVKPFRYGNELTLSAFMDYFGKLPNFAQTNTQIDFRRLTHEQADVLRTSDSKEKIAQIFEAALNHELTPRLINKPNEFGTLSNKSVHIAGLNFLQHEVDGKTYLVTVNGGLVEKEKTTEALRTYLAKPDHFVARFSVKPDRYLDISMTIPDAEHKGEKKEIKLKDLKAIDGYEIKEDGAAPLVCLDLNILTGLRGSYHDQVMKYMASKNMPLFQLKDEGEAKRLVADAPEKLKHLLAIAAPHVRHITHQLDDAKDFLFHEKRADKPTPIPVPYITPAQLVISMGGPGSGKSAAQDLISAYTNNNYIETSLDKARSFSGLYEVLQSVNHQSDDYAVVEPFGVEMRKWVSERARAAHYNVLYDGTGIDFKPRYEDIAKQYKAANYNNTVCMVDAMFTVPKGREAECPKSVIKRITSRSKEGTDQRILPWKITLSKHIGVMKSFLSAFRSKYIDKTVALCNDGPSKDATYIMAESFNIKSPKEYNPMENDDHASSFLQAKEKLGCSDSAMLAFARYEEDTKSSVANRHGKKTDSDLVNHMIKKIPYFDARHENNITRLYDDSSGQNRELIITNTTRMVDVAQKALLNREASGPSSILTISPDYSFIVPQTAAHHSKVPGEVPLQMPSQEYRDAVAQKYNDQAMFLSA